MISFRKTRRLLTQPAVAIGEILADERPATSFLSGLVLPLSSIRAAAVLVSSLIVGTPVIALVLATSSMALQLGAWIATTLGLPVVARQLGEEISDRQALILVSCSSVPLWLAGILYLVPPDPPALLIWSRGLVLAAGTYGGAIFYQGLGHLEIERRMPLVAAGVGMYVVVYAILFALTGISSHVLLFILGAS